MTATRMLTHFCILVFVLFFAGCTGSGGDDQLPQTTAETPQNGLSTCRIIPGDRYTTCGEGGPITIIQGPESNGYTLVSLDMQRHTTATIEVTVGAEYAGWVVHIGDSATNNGYGGDAGTQANDAEVQVLDDTFGIYGSDYTPAEATLDGNRHIRTVDRFVRPQEVITITIADGMLQWRNQNDIVGDLNAPYLFALAGQDDNEGEVNNTLYAAFNGVISGGREGQGAEIIEIILGGG